MKQVVLSHPLRIRTVMALGATALALVVTGCGLGTTAVTPSPNGISFNGNVHGGQQPVTNGHIALFATSSGGYNGSLTPLATTTSDSNGNFQISSSYTCPADQQAYIVSTGGNPGMGVGTDNSAIFMVAALGSCTNVSNSTFVIVNEVTTVAAAYALSGFLPAGGAGMTEAAVVAGTAMPGVTTSSTNKRGLADAFANAANIVNYSTGTAFAQTPAGNGVVPQATINALADILQTCVNSSSPGDCSSFFASATPPSETGVSAPVNVFQAILNIARYPANNASALFTYISSTPAFASTLTAAPSDWTLGVAYTAPLLNAGSGLGIDANDNVYIAGTPYLIEFSAQGASLTSSTLLPAVASADPLREIVFDKTGNLFVTDGNVTGIYEYSPSSSTGTFLSFNQAPANASTPAGAVNPNTYGITVDGSGNVFTSSYSKSGCSGSATGCYLFEFPSTATTTPTAYPAYAPFSSFGGVSVPQPTGAIGGARGMAYDVNTNNLWITAIDDNLAELAKLTPSTTGGAATAVAITQLSGFGAEAGTPASNTNYGTISVAVDSSANAWFVVMGGPVVTGSKATAAVPAALYPVSSAGTVGTAITGGGLTTPTQVSIDGNNNLFIANTGGSTVVEYSPALSAFLSGTTGFAPSSTGTLYQPSYLEIDRSGAVWALSSGDTTKKTPTPANLMQILGVAAPTDPVLANGKYGVKP